MLQTADGGLILPARYRPDARRVKTKSSRSCTGSLVLGEDWGQRLEFESRLERDAVLVMNARPDVVRVLTQYPRFRYKDRRGNPQIYTFDMEVTMRNGDVVAVEVKPELYVKKNAVKARLTQLAAIMPRAVADRVVLVTERDLHPVSVANGEIIHAARFPDPEADDRTAAALSHVLGSVAIADLSVATGLGTRVIHSVARLIKAGEVVLCAYERIGMSSRIRTISQQHQQLGEIA